MEGIRQAWRHVPLAELQASELSPPSRGGCAITFQSDGSAASPVTRAALVRRRRAQVRVRGQHRRALQDLAPPSLRDHRRLPLIGYLSDFCARFAHRGPDQLIAYDESQFIPARVETLEAARELVIFVKGQAPRGTQLQFSVRIMPVAHPLHPKKQMSIVPGHPPVAALECAGLTAYTP
jgi:hypothetical protein